MHGREDCKEKYIPFILTLGYVTKVVYRDDTRERKKTIKDSIFSVIKQGDCAVVHDAMY